MEPLNEIIPSLQILNERPLSSQEIDRFTQLFKELVAEEVEIRNVEGRRGALRDELLVAKANLSLHNFFKGDRTQVEKLKDQLEVYSPESWNELDKQLNASQQNFLRTTYKVVELLRSRNEEVEWEHDMSDTIQAMQRWYEVTKALPPDIAEKFEAGHRLLEREIKEHHDQSSEFFLRYAQHNAIDVSPTPDIYHEVSASCAFDFAKLRQHIWDYQAASVEEQYRTVALSVKAFGLAFANYKVIATTITKSNYQNLYTIFH